MPQNDDRAGRLVCPECFKQACPGCGVCHECGLDGVRLMTDDELRTLTAEELGSIVILGPVH